MTNPGALVISCFPVTVLASGLSAKPGCARGWHTIVGLSRNSGSGLTVPPQIKAALCLEPAPFHGIFRGRILPRRFHSLGSGKAGGTGPFSGPCQAAQRPGGAGPGRVVRGSAGVLAAWFPAIRQPRGGSEACGGGGSIGGLLRPGAWLVWAWPSLFLPLVPRPGPLRPLCLCHSDSRVRGAYGTCLPWPVLP